MKFEDVNGDGEIDADDKVRLDKNDVPNFNFGVTLNFQYKNFDLVDFGPGCGRSVASFRNRIRRYRKLPASTVMTIDGPLTIQAAQHPRLAIRGDTYYTGGNFGDNTYFLYNKNYVRLKNVELGYNIPVKLPEKVLLSNSANLRQRT